MDPKFQTSFIPKQSLAEAPVYRRSIGVNLIIVISFVVFFAVLAAAAGLYLYEKSLNTSIAAISAQLAQARSDLDPALVKELKRTDSRIQNAKALIAAHYSVSTLLMLLGQTTLQSGISFNSLDYVNDGTSIDVTTKGKAIGFTPVALESEAISQNPNFINPNFSNVGLDQSGYVDFTLKFSANPAYLQYAKTLAASGGAAH